MHLVILSGAGISAESGVKTFRDNNGLWENHRVEDVATPEAFARNPALVYQFYNQRRAQLHEVAPNDAHRIIAELEQQHDVSVITQNVDDLHERAGSTNVLHLHGELRKARPSDGRGEAVEWLDDLGPEHKDGRGVALRPHIVWFGEDVPLLPRAARIVSTADVVIIIGTSMQVYPAAGLVGYAPEQAAIFYVDPNPSINYELRQRRVTLFEMGGSEGMRAIRDVLQTFG